MIRLALLAATTCLLSCTLPDQTEAETASVDQDIALSTTPAVCDGTPYDKVVYAQLPGNHCLTPTLWNPATQNTLADFWAGLNPSATAASPAKVMFYVEMYGQTPVSTTYVRPSMYVIYGAGAYDGTNALWKAVEVSGPDIVTYHNLRRSLYDAYEANGVIWDGGSGVPLGGQPGGHIGPHGFPLVMTSAFLDLFTQTRLDYGSKIQNGISGFAGE